MGSRVKLIERITALTTTTDEANAHKATGDADFHPHHLSLE